MNWSFYTEIQTSQAITSFSFPHIEGISPNVCAEPWDLPSLNDQSKTFSRRRTISIGTVEMDAGRRPVLSGVDGLVGNSNLVKQKVKIFVLLITVILLLQALSVTQPIPDITVGKE